MTHGPSPLEPSTGEMREMGEAALAYLLRFVESLEDAPAAGPEGAEEVAARFREPAPEDGEPFDEVLAVFEDGARAAVETAGPGFLGYIPGGGLFTAAIAALLGFGTNRFVNHPFAAPALVQIEATVIRWFADLFGYPASAQGVLTSGGSMANLSALVTARHVRGRGVIYVSEQTHHSVAKSAQILGFDPDEVREVPTTADLRIDVQQLRRAVGEDRAAGRGRMAVVGTAGTTNTGAVDRLGDLADVASAEDMWFHVDAAYGGFFQLTEGGRRALRGIERADSITLDPHKSLFLPYGTGCLLVREGDLLRDAHRLHGVYMQDAEDHEEIPVFSDHSPELSRDFRGLRVWMPIKLHGLAAFREALDEKLGLARRVYDALREAPGFEVPWEPELSTVAFRYVPEEGDPDAFNAGLVERVNASGRVWLSSTTIDGRFMIRISILSHRTHRDRVDEAIEIVQGEAKALEGGR